MTQRHRLNNSVYSNNRACFALHSWTVEETPIIRNSRMQEELQNSGFYILGVRHSLYLLGSEPKATGEGLHIHAPSEQQSKTKMP